MKLFYVFIGLWVALTLVFVVPIFGSVTQWTWQTTWCSEYVPGQSLSGDYCYSVEPLVGFLPFAGLLALPVAAAITLMVRLFSGSSRRLTRS